MLLLLLLLLTTVQQQHFTKTTTSRLKSDAALILMSDVSCDDNVSVDVDAHIQYPALTGSARPGDILGTVSCKESVPSSLLRPSTGSRLPGTGLASRRGRE